MRFSLRKLHDADQRHRSRQEIRGSVVEGPAVLSTINEASVVLAKKASNNQITLPKAVITRFSEVEYFEVSTDGECIILRPLQKSRADEVRARLAQLGIAKQDVTAAISWSRETSPPPSHRP